jgi:hypothetical protein
MPPGVATRSYMSKIIHLTKLAFDVHEPYVLSLYSHPCLLYASLHAPLYRLVSSGLSGRILT